MSWAKPKTCTTFALPNNSRKKPMNTQTILGAGGAIGRPLALEIRKFTDKVRLVSRNPKKMHPGDQLFSADLKNAQAVMDAVKGSEVVYLTAGLTYTVKVWQAQWPVIMANVIAACKAHGAKLVFFDNIYMYSGEHLDPITEDLPIAPPSRKGAVRARIAQMLLEAHASGDIEALIARSADFYGPGTGPVSVLNELVFGKISQGKTATWLGNPKCRHSFTYVPDAVQATALLGNTPDAYGEVWHLPTHTDPPKGQEWVEEAARQCGTPPKLRSVGRGMLRFLGLFVPIMGQLVEMMYQYEQDYVFSSAKYDKRFGPMATTYQDGIKAVLKSDFKGS
jgi:nucleoside-diphosphate-sugar epimerase